MTPALGVHDLAHDVSEATVAQLTEEARSCSSIVHSLLNVLQSCSGHKQSQRWRRGVAVTLFGVSTRLLYVGPVSTRMGDRLRQIKHLSISPSQLSLLPSAGREMSTSQSAVMLCGWGVKASMVYSTCG